MKQENWIYGLLNNRPKFQITTLIFLIVSLPLIYFFVLETGGIKYVYSHTMYIPIIVAAVVFGLKGGLIVAFIAGILLGPFMPIEVATGETQELVNWLYRMAAFLFVGGFVGFVCDYLRKQIDKSHKLYTVFPETKLPNYESFKEIYNVNASMGKHIAITVNVNNYEEIVAMLGRDLYIEVIRGIYDFLKGICYNIEIIQIDFRKLWVITHVDIYKEKFKEVLNYFERDVYKQEGLSMFVDVSLGVCVCDETHQYTLNEALRASEVAAISAKNRKLRYAVYQDDFASASIDLERLGALPEAIINDELFMEYHPIIDVKNGKVVGLEALVRWRYKGEIVPPLDFIPIAEETKLIDLITEYIVNKVSEEYESFSNKDNLTVYINISQRNLYNPSLIERIIKVISKHNQTYKSIGIEMTESTLMLNTALTKTLLEMLKSNNIPISLDDFGTGYSTLFALNELPIDHIKIDREVTNKVENDISTQKLVKLIVDYAHDLNLRVIAEGVETEDMLETLLAYKCDAMQGFYFTKSLGKDEMIEWLKSFSLNR